MAYINGSDDFAIVLNNGGGNGGTGENGATFTPSVSSAGVISWTNDKGLQNPAPVNIKGQKGADGVSPIVSIMELSDGVLVTITDKDGAKSFKIPYGTSNDSGSGDNGGNETIYHTVSVFATHILTNGVTSVPHGGEYRATFTPYTDDNGTGNIEQCRVFMGGEEITDTVMWEGNTLTISSVTGDIEITFEEIAGDYYEDVDGNNSVKLVLANVCAYDTGGNVLGNGSRYVMSGDPFWCDLHAIEGEGTNISYRVTCDGEDITSQCRGDENLENYKQIRIDTVGGDIVITAWAE